jgi:hypothetical protein
MLRIGLIFLFHLAVRSQLNSPGGISKRKGPLQGAYDCISKFSFPT